jgi:hypothetical protein
MGSDYWEQSKRGEPMEVTWPEASQCAPLRVYIELRDELWHELAYRKRVHGNFEEVMESARSLAVLHLANTVATALLTARDRSPKDAVELLRCEVCNTFIEHAARETHARVQPDLTLNVVRRSLELAIS